MLKTIPTVMFCFFYFGLVFVFFAFSVDGGGVRRGGWGKLGERRQVGLTDQWIGLDMLTRVPKGWRGSSEQQSGKRARRKQRSLFVGCLTSKQHASVSQGHKKTKN